MLSVPALFIEHSDKDFQAAEKLALSRLDTGKMNTH